MKNIKNPIMVLIPTAELAALEKAGYAGATPLVKLFMGPLTWLVTGIEDGILYGYADLSMGCVEWGSLCLVSELSTLKVGIAYIERDRHWKHVEGTKYLEMESLMGI
jgi:hypothetical protein